MKRSHELATCNGESSKVVKEEEKESQSHF